MKKVYVLVDSYSPDIRVYENPFDAFHYIVDTLNYYYHYLKKFTADDLVNAVNELADSYEQETGFFGCTIGDLSMNCYMKAVH